MKDLINKLFEPKDSKNTYFTNLGSGWTGYDVSLLPDNERYKKPLVKITKTKTEDLPYEIECYRREKIMESFMRFLFEVFKK